MVQSTIMPSSAGLSSVDAGGTSRRRRMQLAPDDPQRAAAKSSPDELVVILAEHVRGHTPTGEPERWLFDEFGRPWHDNLVDYRWRSTRADAGHTHKLHD